MARIQMIRHGKPSSVWGQSDDGDPGLDDRGREQARAARDALLALPDDIRPRLVLSSPLRRCRETAEPFAAALGVPLEIDPAVGEIPTPAALSLAERPIWLRKAFAGTWADIVGDLDYEVWRRQVVEAVKARAGYAVFSHYVAINAVVSFVTGDDRVLGFRPDHASITSFDVEDGALSLAMLGREAETQVL